MIPRYSHVLILGAGSGLSAALARRFAADGLRVTLAARTIEDLAPLAEEIGAARHACDAADPEAVAALFAALDAEGAPDVLVYNAARRARGGIAEIAPRDAAEAVQVTAMGAFFAAHEAARRMQPAGHGAMLFTGASAAVKGYARSAPFAMGKFALRGLCQSLARELHPQGVHVGLFNIDGGIRAPGREESAPDALLDPEAIARSYAAFLAQDRSAWAWEIDLRPWTETF